MIPETARAYCDRGIANFELNRRQAALDDLTEAIAIDPERDELYETRAYFHVVAGDWNAALADWTSVVKLRPKLAYPLAKRALIYASLGEMNKADADRAAAVAIDPKETDELAPRSLMTPAATMSNIAPAPPVTPENLLAEFELSDVRSGLILPVRMGDRTFKFCLDTGCTTTVVNRSLRSLLGAEQGWVTIDSMQASMHERLYGPPKLSLGKLTVQLTKPVLCIDLGHLRSAFGEPIDGVLGMDVLSQFVVRLDCLAQKVSFLRSADDAPGKAFVLVRSNETSDVAGSKFGDLYRTMAVEGRLPDGGTTRFMVDTGAVDTSVNLKSEIFSAICEKRAIILSPKPIVRATASGVYAPRTGVLTSLTLGDFHHRHLSVTETPSSNLLGLNYLSRYVVTFDFPGRQLFLQPSADYAVSETKLKVMGRRPWGACYEFIDAEKLNAICDAFIELNPASPAAFNNRGDYWLSQRKIDRAIADYTEAIRVERENPNGLYHRGLAQQKQGKFVDAIGDFSAAIRIDPEWGSAYAERAWSSYQIGDFDAAIRDYTKVISVDPRYHDAYCARACVLMEKGDWRNAVNDFTHAIRINPKSAEAFRQRGSLWHMKRELDRALTDLTEAIRLNPKDPLTYIYRAAVWIDKQDAEHARQDSNAVIQLNPDSAAACVARGQIAELGGNFNQAMQEYALAIQRGFDFPQETRKQILASNEQLRADRSKKKGR